MDNIKQNQPIGTPPKSTLERINEGFKNSIMVKIFFIIFAILILLIPKEMIMDVVYERQSYQNSAIEEVQNRWASEQEIKGPMLKVPYLYTTKNDKGKEIETLSYFLTTPTELDIKSNVENSFKTRSIYTIPIYTSKIDFKGSFKKPTEEFITHSKPRILWDRVQLLVNISDPKGLIKNVKLNWDGQTQLMNKVNPMNYIFRNALGTVVTFEKEDKENSTNIKTEIPFNFTIELKGSNSISILPTGDETHLNMSSNSPDPNFYGHFPPYTSNIDVKGFDAEWSVLTINRDFASVIDQAQLGASLDKKIDVNMMRVEFLTSLDQYSLTLRAAKYSVLVITVCFMVFFLVEVLAKERIHPVQYLLIGIAIIIFYLVLLAIAEHIDFNISYIIAALSVVGIITGYAYAIFKQKKFAWVMSMALCFCFTYIFITLSLVEFALLFGSIGALIAIALTMYLTRKVEWYK